MENILYIDGHQVPSRISSLIQQGNWKAPQEISAWTNMISKDYVFQPTFYDLARLSGRSVWNANAGDDFIGIHEDGLHPGALDPNFAIIIGDLGPERFLALDLRTSASNPAVCAFIPRENADSCWIQIAASLDEFLQILDLK